MAPGHFGAGIGAVVGGLAGAPACLGVAAALFLVQAALILLSPAVPVRRQPQTEAKSPAGLRGECGAGFQSQP